MDYGDTLTKSQTIIFIIAIVIAIAGAVFVAKYCENNRLLSVSRLEKRVILWKSSNDFSTAEIINCFHRPGHFGSGYCILTPNPVLPPVTITCNQSMCYRSD